MTVIVFCALWASGQDAASARRGVEQAFRRWEALGDRRDAAGMAQLMDPSGYTVDLDGSRWPFSRAKQDLPGLFEGRRNMKMRIRIDRFSYGGGEAVAWITTTTTYEKKVGGKWVRKTSLRRDADTLRKFGNEWKFVFSQVLP